MIAIAFSIVMFAFTLNVGFWFIGYELGIETLQDKTPAVLDPNLFNPQNGTAGSLLNQTSSGAGFGAAGLLGDAVTSLNIVYQFLSNGYLVAIMQSVGGFPDTFTWPMQAVMTVVNIVTAIQLVRGLVFS